jgi:two-component system sensor histidine kinase SenX3
VVALVVVVVAIVAAGVGAAVTAAVAAGSARAQVAAAQRAALAEAQRVEGAEAELARLRLALDGIDQGVLVADAQGQIVHRNAVAEGFASARHADALVEAAIGELVAEAVAGVPSVRTLDLFGPPRRTLVVTATPLPSTEGTGALAVIEDISERRHLEAVRRDFVANISHELKTPVGAIGLLAETLQAEDDPAVTARLAARVQSEAFRVARTIDDLLELSRIESGLLPARQRVAAADVVIEAVERIGPAAGHAGIEILVRTPRVDAAVLGDPRQLVSATFNLLDNAVKYSDRGSTVEVAATVEGRQVQVTVTDHGIGIPTGDIERVFERFYRVDQARSRETGGTGLGLAIVRHVAGNHDGEVSVASQLGVGSRFTLSLPAAPPVAAPPGPAAGALGATPAPAPVGADDRVGAA